MVQLFCLAERVNEVAVDLDGLFVPFDQVVKVGLYLEEEFEILICLVEDLVGPWVPCEDYFHADGYGLGSKTLDRRRAQALRCLLDCDRLVRETSLQSIVGERV